MTLLLLALVGVHLALNSLLGLGVGPDQLLDGMPERDRSELVGAVALGVAGVAAMVGGFAGVVVVFGLSSDDERFRQVRLRAATSLRQNWMSVVTTPLVAAFGALVAAAIALRPSLTGPAMWLLEVCVVVAAHGAVRLVIVLRELVKVVAIADKAWLAAQSDSDDGVTLDLD